MKIIITSESGATQGRLNNILTGIPGVEVVAQANDIEETIELLDSLKPEVVIFYPHKTSQSMFNKLKEIKNVQAHPDVIILNDNSLTERVSPWHESGADYVFDSLSQVNNMVDLLCELLYTQKFEEMQLYTANNNKCGPANSSNRNNRAAKINKSN